MYVECFTSNEKRPGNPSPLCKHTGTCHGAPSYLYDCPYPDADHTKKESGTAEVLP